MRSSPWNSILTAVGMTDHLPVMVIAVVVAVLVMLFAADPLANFIHNNPTVVMLALGFLLMIGVVLIADGFGSPCSEGLYLHGDGFLGRRRGTEHLVAAEPRSGRSKQRMRQTRSVQV